MPTALLTELAISSTAVVITIASTHCTHPYRDGQAKSSMDKLQNLSVFTLKGLHHVMPSKSIRKFLRCLWEIQTETLSTSINCCCCCYYYCYYYYFRFCLTGQFSKVTPFQAGSPNAKYCGIVWAGLLQAWCPSCYTTNNVKTLNIRVSEWVSEWVEFNVHLDT